MPPAIVAIAGIAAGYATTAILGTSLLATLAAGFVGLAVTYGLSAAFGLNKKPKIDLSAYAQDRKQLIRGTAEPRQIIYGKAQVSGPLVFARSTGSDLRFLHLVVPLAGHPVHAIDSVWINDTEIPSEQLDSGGMVTGGDFAGLVRIKKHLGRDTVADADLVAEVDDWTAAHKLLGVAYLYIRLEYDQDAFAAGLNNVKANVRGKDDIYDPRTETSGYTDNWALCLLDYLRAEFGLACADDEIEWTTMSAAANIADEQVQLDAAATLFQPRYTLNGSFKLDERPIDIISKMQAAGAGELVYVQGAYRLYAGAYDSPTVELTPSDAAGPIKVNTKPALSDLFNAVKGTYVAADQNYAVNEFPAVTDLDAEAADGERIWQEVEFPFTIDGIAAQRLATITLRRARAPITVTIPMRYASIRLCVWEMVSLTFPDFGWDAKPFRITRWTFDPSTGQVSLVLREETASIWAWIYDDAQPITPGAGTTLISPINVPPPTAVTLTASTAIQADGAVVPSLVATWTPAAHAFVTATEVQWRQRGDATNLITYPSQIDNAAWIKGNCVITANAVAAPDGTISADLLVETTAASAFHYITWNATKPATAARYTAVIYVLQRSGNTRFIGLTLSGTGAGAVFRFNPATGAIVASAGTYGSFSSPSASITAVGGGWWRMEISAITDATTGIHLQCSLYSGATNVYTGDGSGGVYLWRAQLSAGDAIAFDDWQSAVIPVPTARWELAPAELGIFYDVRARSVAGLARSIWTGAITGTGMVDTVAPGVPTGLTVTGITRGAALRWTNPADKDLAKVEIWERGTVGSSAKVGESNSDFFVRSGFDPNETRWFKLRAVDRSGNASAFTAEVSGTSTLLVSNDIGEGVINAGHLQTTTAVITEAAQIADLTVQRIHLQSDAVSTHDIDSWTASVAVDKPGGGYAYASLGGIDVNVGEDGRVIVIVQVRGSQASTPTAPVETHEPESGGGL